MLSSAYEHMYEARVVNFSNGRKSSGGRPPFDQVSIATWEPSERHRFIFSEENISGATDEILPEALPKSREFCEKPQKLVTVRHDQRKNLRRRPPQTLSNDLECQCGEMEFKVFNDVIHGHMEFHPLLVVLIDTPQMQRLRNLKQLGACSFVYPSAIHTRFEHSLGTAFIAGKMFDSLKEKGLPSDVTDDVLWEKKKLCAQIAGLCHDIGHGPFSHLWEAFRRRFNDKWAHEEESVLVFDEVLNERISPSKKFNGTSLERVRDAFEYYGLDAEDIKTIKVMISGDKKRKHYLYQVISNKNNQIDVDKWEYLARDSVMLNIPIGFDFKRLLNYCCVLKNEQGGEEIGFRVKECPVLVEMFLARGKLHDVAYKHTKVKIIEEMIIDAFELADESLQLRNTPITKLTDHIYHKILYDDFGNDKNMKKAKEIVRRIETRHLYKCIAQESYGGKPPKAEEVKKSLRLMIGLQDYVDEIKVSFVEVHMTKANKHKPLRNLLVWRKLDDQIVSEVFDWHKYNDCLKPNVENLKRNQILLLYTGTDEFPHSLKEAVGKELRRMIVDMTS